MAITAELENISPVQQEANFKKFRRDTQKYILDEWTTPERVNGPIYKEISRSKINLIEAINEIYDITETTKFQAKVAVEIYEQLQYLLKNELSPEQIRPVRH
ncbi:MAG: hypothetical protein EXX96DRAFT_584586 [Benjaminiella poitrasii]|nr:MAG: hypothetical protein EXX96DRAFT_584586 [Benjaminiella poitrasii]